MTEVSLFRLYALRAGYLFVAAGLAATVWPLLINHSPQWPLMNSVVCSMLGAVSVLAAFGIRYPLQMLPVLLFEVAWKSIWLIAVALPLWSANQLDSRTWETVRDCLLGAILIPLIPWRYVIAGYVTAPGDRWRRVARAPSSGAVGGSITESRHTTPETWATTLSKAPAPTVPLAHEVSKPPVRVTSWSADRIGPTIIAAPQRGHAQVARV
jgi:hypothetical protein